MKIINIKFILIVLLIVPEIIGQNQQGSSEKNFLPNDCSEESINKIEYLDAKHKKICQCCHTFGFNNICDTCDKINNCRDSDYRSELLRQRDEKKLEECCKLVKGDACHYNALLAFN